jgi:hypothetical protein
MPADIPAAGILVKPNAIGRDLRRVEIKVLAGFLVALALLILAGGYTYTTSVAFADSVEWVAHTQGVRVSLAELSGSMANAELAQRDFLLSAEAARAVVSVARRTDGGSTPEVLAQVGRMDAVEVGLLSERQATSEHNRVITFISLVITLALSGNATPPNARMSSKTMAWVSTWTMRGNCSASSSVCIAPTNLKVRAWD